MTKELLWNRVFRYPIYLIPLAMMPVYNLIKNNFSVLDILGIVVFSSIALITLYIIHRDNSKTLRGNSN